MYMTEYSPPRTITFGFLSQLGVAMIACHLMSDIRLFVSSLECDTFEKKQEEGEKERDDRTARWHREQAYAGPTAAN